MASQWPPKKNTAFTLFFTLYKNDGTVIANPGTYTKKVSIDGAAIADISASVTEEDTTYGQLSVVLSADEMNGDAIWVQIKDDTSGCVPFTTVLYTTGSLHDELKADTAAILADTGTDGVVLADDAITAAKIAADARALFGIVASGTMQAGSTATTAVLAAATDLANDLINGAVIVINGGTGAGQSRLITDWVQATDTATVDAWTTTPDNTSTYVVFAAAPASATALPPVNVLQWSSAAVATPTQAGVPEVDLTYVAGAAVSTTAAQLGVSAVAISTTAVDAVLDEVVETEGSITLRQAAQVLIAGLAGVLSGNGTETVTIKTPNGEATRISASIDTSDNRTAITLTF